MADGRVVQVNVSAGGVPKLPVARAWVGPLGLAGDAHNDRTEHGGPHRAVCLFGVEAIARLRADGHPVEAGSVGENLTTAGIEWSTLPVGTRARIGAQLELELASAAGPCATQTHNFRDGKFSRMSIELHPTDSRMYARVLREGEAQAGDPIAILPPAPQSRAADELVLGRLDKAEGKSSLAVWQAAAEGGIDVRIRADGELFVAASPDIPGSAYNRALGLSRLPNLLSEVTDFFDANRCVGWLKTAHAPWPGQRPEGTVRTYAAHPAQVAEAPLAPRVALRPLRRDEGDMVGALYRAAGTVPPVASGKPNAWPVVYEALANHPHRVVLIVELNGRPIGVASLHTYHRTAWIGGMAVAPEARGMGIQRALLAARAKLAIERGCDLMGASAKPGDLSARNLERMGFSCVGTREHYRYVPAGQHS